MYIVPALGVLLTVVLFAGSRTLSKDMHKLEKWMRESAEQATGAGASAK
jgi:hypothetical protein